MNQLRKLDNEINFKDRKQCRRMDIDVVATPSLYKEIKVLRASDEFEFYKIKDNLGKEELVFTQENAPLDIYFIEGYPHTVRGDNSTCSLYACMSGEAPSLESLRPFDNKNWTPWSYKVESCVYLGKRGWQSSYDGIVYRNNRLFCKETRNTADDARRYCEAIIDSTKEFYGAELDERYWDRDIRDKKFKWRGIPLSVGYIVDGQNAIITNEEVDIDEDGEMDTLKLELLSSEIDWFPSYPNSSKDERDIKIVKVGPSLTKEEQQVLEEFHLSKKKLANRKTKLLKLKSFFGL